MSNTVRPERTMARAGLWATGPVQLELPLDAEGLSELVRANGRLKLSPDFDVFAWLCERWLAAGKTLSPEGWVFFTLRELAMALYGKDATRLRRELRASIRRLRSVQVNLIGYDAEHGAYNRQWQSNVNLLNALVSELDDVGADAKVIGALRGSTFRVQLAPWLTAQLTEGHVARVNWRVLRSFDGTQKLAKRLYIYLCAESYKPDGDGKEATWIRVGDKLFCALGMNYAQPRDARKALRAACAVVSGKEARFTEVGFYSPNSRYHQIRAQRWTGDVVKRELATQRSEARKAVDAFRAAVGELDAD